MESSPLAALQRIRSWLAIHWRVIVGTLLCCLGIFYMFPQGSGPVLPAAPKLPLSKKAVRHADEAQVARLDSIRQEVQTLSHLAHSRDSTLAAAHRQNAHANHYLKLLTRETTPAAPLANYLASTLANYQPGTYSLDSTNAIR
jgi:hypothetical protein